MDIKNTIFTSLLRIALIDDNYILLKHYYHSVPIISSLYRLTENNMKKLFIGLTILSSTVALGSSELDKDNINDKLLLDAACKLECSLGSVSGDDGSYSVKKDIQYVDFKGMSLKEIEKRENSACNRLVEQADEEGRFNLSREVEKMTCKYFKH